MNYDLFNSISILMGAVGLMLYCMQRLCITLSDRKNNRLTDILERSLSNKYTSLLSGLVGTVCMQSSSAFTVFLCGLAGGGILNMAMIFPAIMGANIGATLIVFLISLPIGEIMCCVLPVFAILSVCDKRRTRVYEIMTIICTIFLTFIIIERTTLTFGDGLEQFFLRSRSPFILLILGMLTTALVQSSSIVTAILLCIYDSGFIELYNAMFVIMGINVGTCMTSILASMGSGKNAGYVAASHTLFNLFGCILFSILLSIRPIANLIIFALSAIRSPKMQLAIFHITYNLTTAVLLLPQSDKITLLLCGWLRLNQKPIRQRLNTTQ